MNNEDSCKILNETASQLIEKGWNFGKESVEKAYFFKIYQGDKIIVFLSYGNETGTKKSANIPVYFEGENINIEMSIFY